MKFTLETTSRVNLIRGYSAQEIRIGEQRLQASCLVRGGNVAIADAFCESRLGKSHGAAFGTLPADASMKALIERALPG